jgi:hypothetical protein
MKFASTPLFLPWIVLVATVFQPTIAQANPSPLVKRSDSAVKMLRSFHDRFNCAPQMTEQRIGFARYEIFSAISTCGNKINELLASSDVNISREELEHLRQLFSAFRVEIDQVELIQSQAVPLPKYDNKYGSPNTGLRSVVMFMPLESPVLVKRSDASFQQWEVVQGKFGCLPLIPIKPSEVTRDEMAAAINSCYDRVSEFAAGINGRPAASPEDLKMFAPLTTEFSTELAALSRQFANALLLSAQQFSQTTKSEATVVFPENSSNPKSIAQANPSQWVKRSDAIFRQWELVQDKFGCAYLPRRPLGQPDFTRYEMAAVINACYDRLSEFVTGINLAGTNGAPAASPEDLKMLEPFVTEFAAEIATLRGPVTGPVTYPSPVLNTGRLIVVYTESGRTIVPYEQFAWRYPSAEYIGPDYDPNAPPRKPAPRSIDAWIIPTLKEFQSRYGCFNGQIQINNPSDLSRSRNEVAIIINACAEGYSKRGIKLRKTDATDFLGMQRAFAEELMSLQERHREVQRQKCLAQTCE